MKKSILSILFLFSVAAAFFACQEQNTPESLRTQSPEQQSPILRDNAYYARLREYKKTPHSLAFGWYGSWTAIGSSEQTRLKSAPDSMDIISIWSTWHSLSAEQMADKAFVQQRLGTKVVFCISAKDMPAEFKVGGTTDGAITEESVIAYAKAWGKDSMDKYQYDGMDIDFETAIDHMGPLNSNKELFKKFCTELSKYIGPKSNTGRLFIIDGNFDASLFPDGVAELCNYAVGQAYNTNSADQLNTRVTRAAAKGWTNEQMIFTENYESLWQGGGPNYTCSDGVVRPSLLGMADYARTTPAIGFGSYHMEYEYGHADMPYKYMRRAIQLANPAPIGDYTKNLITLNEAGTQSFSVVKLPSGMIIGDKVEATFTAQSAGIIAKDTDLNLFVDNSMIAAYNEYYFADYKPLDAKFYTISGPLHFVAGTQSSKTPITISIPDFSTIPAGEYLLPVCVDFSKASEFSANTAKKVKYLLLSLQHTPIITSIPGSDKPQTISVYSFADNSLVGTVSSTVTGALTIGASDDVTAILTVDPAAVEVYNTLHSTTYTPVNAADVTITGSMLFANGQKKSTAATISMSDLSKLPADNSMIAVRMTMPADKLDYKVSETESVVYIIINKTSGGNLKPQQVLGDYTTECTLIENNLNNLGWTFVPINPTTGETPARMSSVIDVAKLFSDNYTGWFAQYLTYAPYWGNGLMLTLDMKSEKSVKAMVWNPYGASYGAKTISQVQTSMNGTDWTSQNKMTLSFASSDPQGITFTEAVNTRYIRIVVMAGYNGSYGEFGMKKLEIWAPKSN